jgi:hypothetical protein
MKKQTVTLFLSLVFFLIQISAQKKLDSVQFFIDERPIAVTISSDFKKLFSTKKETPWQETTITLRMPDSTVITEGVQMRARGNYRKTECYMPSLMINFHNPTSPRTYELDKLKIVSGCGTAVRDEQLVLKEYLAYKMYNLLTPISFRVRLIRLSFEDSKGKIKKYTTWGFFIEDVDDMAKRNKYKEYEIATEQRSTNQERMTFVSLFQYLIGNTDWSVPNFHNIKLLMPKKDSNALPLPVPYDFDFAGMVDADYATPAEIMGTEKVTERVYRGFARPMDEIMLGLNRLKEKRTELNNLIMNFDLLPEKSRKEIVKYFDEFYKIADNQREIQKIFIDEARKN